MKNGNYKLKRKFDKQLITEFFKKPTTKEIREFLLKYLGESDVSNYIITK